MQKERVLQFVAVACSSIKDPALLKRTLIDFLKAEWPDIMEGKRLVFPYIMMNWPLSTADIYHLKPSSIAAATLDPKAEVINVHIDHIQDINIVREMGKGLSTVKSTFTMVNEVVDMLIRTMANMAHQAKSDQRISEAARGAREVMDGKPDLHTRAAADGVFRGKPFGQDLLFNDAWKFMLMGNTVKRKGWTGSQYLKLQNGEPHHFTGSVGNKVNHMPIEDATATDWYINN